MDTDKLETLLGNQAHEFDLAVRITKEEDIAVARQMAKQLAQEMGFSLADTTKIATAVSELARNIYRYAKQGRILLRKKNAGKSEPAIEIIAADRGPGIPDVDLVLTKGYTTYERSLGIGLSGVKRLMDSFAIYSEVGKGTVVVAEKRRRRF
ncbi:putative anti-sigma regulatory factor, serine/threonine protein kinase [Ammonifex degensii KC4]|uniref:Anti-sigma regulatory factor, serine/threonine protein kinase n=1 Tax=Ammonifex degensii (strain DSM 10501 / KC4) TaxID=429009 RepID=C9R9C0_AMMDK|nr:anti-sigma regulatory factor [Ammonifex degensii]ACX52899.1 putative anti-sigma regulatory factor, serine/threonine protein kinase [Ammonifex degensii KC4]